MGTNLIGSLSNLNRVVGSRLGYDTPARAIERLSTVMSPTGKGRCVARAGIAPSLEHATSDVRRYVGE